MLEKSNYKLFSLLNFASFANQWNLFKAWLKRICLIYSLFTKLHIADDC
jgi:hypothetical protein